MNHIKKSLIWGRHRLVLETGEIARQASGAMLVNMEDTIVLVTVVGARQAQAGKDFLPLTVTTRSAPTPPARFPAVFSGAKDAPRKRRFSPAG